MIFIKPCTTETHTASHHCQQTRQFTQVATAKMATIVAKLATAATPAAAAEATKMVPVGDKVVAEQQWPKLEAAAKMALAADEVVAAVKMAAAVESIGSGRSGSCSWNGGQNRTPMYLFLFKRKNWTISHVSCQTTQTWAYIPSSWLSNATLAPTGDLLLLQPSPLFVSV